MSFRIFLLSVLLFVSRWGLAVPSSPISLKFKFSKIDKDAVISHLLNNYDKQKFLVKDRFTYTISLKDLSNGLQIVIDTDKGFTLETLEIDDVLFTPEEIKYYFEISPLKKTFLRNHKLHFLQAQPVTLIAKENFINLIENRNSARLVQAKIEIEVDSASSFGILLPKKKSRDAKAISYILKKGISTISFVFPISKDLKSPRFIMKSKDARWCINGFSFNQDNKTLSLSGSEILNAAYWINTLDSINEMNYDESKVCFHIKSHNNAISKKSFTINSIAYNNLLHWSKFEYIGVVNVQLSKYTDFNSFSFRCFLPNNSFNNAYYFNYKNPNGFYEFKIYGHSANQVTNMQLIADLDSTQVFSIEEININVSDITLTLKGEQILNYFETNSFSKVAESKPNQVSIRKDFTSPLANIYKPIISNKKPLISMEKEKRAFRIFLSSLLILVILLPIFNKWFLTKTVLNE